LTDSNGSGNSKYSAKVKEFLSALRRRPARYWVRLVVVVIVAEYLVGVMDDKGLGVSYRYRFYAWLQRKNPTKPADRNTVVVLIGDEEYWKGKPQHRTPINRSYLAELLRRLDAANAKVIAFDFDLRSPTPDGNPLESPDYQRETQAFLETVKQVAANRSVVLSRAIWQNDDGDYGLDSMVYDDFDFGSPKVSFGFIQLPYDKRKVPLQLDLGGGNRVDSFALAIARAFRPTIAERLPQSKEAPYGTFLEREDFKCCTLSAQQVLAGDLKAIKDGADGKEGVDGHVVIVGGDWNKLALGRGGSPDSHETPVGPMLGAFLHGNYVEAILNSTVYPPLGETAFRFVQWGTVATMALAFAIVETPVVKLIVVALSWAVILGVSYFAFISVGIVFDVFVPALSVTMHWILERQFGG
jgi:CHASE2 domain-containing sensor protein